MSAALKLKSKLSPRDHGLPITDEELAISEFVQGFKYEVIEGRLYVSYEPDAPEDWVTQWLHGKLLLFSLAHAEIINYVSTKARVFVPMPRRGDTIPEPDLAAYLLLPKPSRIRGLNWREISPLLVAEVFSGGDPQKDLVRNVSLYERVPDIGEYWVIDISEDPDRPTMIVYRRRGTRWQRPIEVGYGETYTTKLLPGFKLLVDPHR